MKIALHVCIGILIACCLALQAAPGFGQQKTAATATTRPVQLVAAQEISKDTVIKKFQQLGQSSREIQLLDSKLRTLQFSPATTSEHYWGKTSSYEGVTAGRSERLVAEIYVRDYVKQNSKDAAGLAQVTLTSTSGSTKTYSFYLLAPGGDFTKLQEYAVTNNAVTLQHSWWTCVKCQLPMAGLQCGQACVQCAPGAVSVVGYLACVGTGCGEAVGIAGACCACNGDRWCSWAVGSCSESGPCPPFLGSGSGSENDTGICLSNADCANGWVCQPVATPGGTKVQEPSAQGEQPTAQTKVCTPPAPKTCNSNANCSPDEHCVQGKCSAY